MSEEHSKHTPYFIPQIGVKEKERADEKYHRAIYHKATAPGFFGVIILCFFMSFVNIRCNGHVVDHYSGFDIIRGKRSSMNTGMDAGEDTANMACKNSAYHCMEKKKEGKLESGEQASTNGTSPIFNIPGSIDEATSNPKTTRFFAILALLCAASGGVLSLLKKYWGAVSQFMIGTTGFLSLFLMHFYIKITLPKVSSPGAPLYSEYQVPDVTTELAFGYWLALFLFLGVSVIGIFRIRYLKRSGKEADN